MSARAAALAGGAAVVAVAGWFVWPGAAPAPLAVVPEVQTAVEPQTALVEPATPAASAPEAVVAAAPEAPAPVQALAEPVTTAADAEVPAAALAVLPPVMPLFDLVRVEPDGSATVAGRAAPGAAVSLRVDGVEVVQAVADAQGSFAALFTLPASAAPRLMTLVAFAPDGAELMGPDTVAVAPTQPAQTAVVVVAPEPVLPAVAPDTVLPAVAPDTVLPSVAPDTVLPAVEPAPAAVPVAEPAPPAALLVTEDGVKVLQPGAEVPAEMAANVSIDTISYAPDGAVQLGGRATAKAFVRLYLDDAEQATVLVAEGGQWAAVLADVAPGIYTLRADQIGAEGKVTSRFETPFKRETLEALAVVAAPEAAPVVNSASAVAPVVETAPLAEPVALAEVVPAPEAIATEDMAPALPEPAPLPAVEPAPAPVVQAEPAKPAPVSVTVQPGFTLWGIAQERFGDGVLYVQVFEANKDKIRDPDLIYPGQIFTIPTPP